MLALRGRAHTIQGRLPFSHRWLYNARRVMIQFQCQCGKLLQAREELAGRMTRCPACEQEFPIPEVSDAGEQSALQPHQRFDDDYPDVDDNQDDTTRPLRSGRSGKAIVSLIL